MILSRVKSKICFLIAPWGRCTGDSRRRRSCRLCHQNYQNIKARFMAFFFMTLIKTFSLTTRRRVFFIFSCQRKYRLRDCHFSTSEMTDGTKNERRENFLTQNHDFWLLLTRLWFQTPLCCAAAASAATSIQIREHIYTIGSLKSSKANVPKGHNVGEEGVISFCSSTTYKP